MFGIIQASKLSADERRSQQLRRYLGRRLADGCHNWKVAYAASSFAKRVTNIKWHPIHSDSVVAYGTFGGDIILWDYKKYFINCPIIRGIGMGYGCITEMRFHLDNPSWIYTTAIDGRFRLQDFEGICSETIQDLNSEVTDNWHCCMDLSADYRLIVVGDNRGNCSLWSLDGHQVISNIPRLHKGKVKYLEFCPARRWMLVSTSVDRTVKFWDIRMLKANNTWDTNSLQKPLSVAEHSGLVSSAYFDPILGVRLLTTAQDGEIRVYSPHDLWSQPTSVISHPHRSFQHMTDIKATWHPVFEDVCVVGRYPGKEDEDKSRTIDLIDVEAKKRVGYFYDPSLKQLIQLNQFNRSGTCLASGMGYTGLIWTCVQNNDGDIVTRASGDGDKENGRGSRSSPENGLADLRKRKRSQSGKTKSEKKIKVVVSNTKEEQRKTKDKNGK